MLETSEDTVLNSRGGGGYTLSGLTPQKESVFS